MTYIPNWPTREEWETRERTRAQEMIEADIHCLYRWDIRPQLTDEEAAERSGLWAVIVKQIRKACGQVERATRIQYPVVAELFSRKIPAFDHDAHRALRTSVEALRGDDEAAYILLWTMRCIRDDLSFSEKYGCHRIDFHRWPDDIDHPASPEATRYNEMWDHAEKRHVENHRDEGRQLLAEINAPDAWDKELKRRALVEERIRNGPVIRRHTA